MVIQLRVSRIHDEAPGIRSFELVHPTGDVLPAFTAGAHIEVTTPSGAVRPYSLCNDPQERHRYLIAVQREPHSRGGSESMHTQVHEGDLLSVSAPKNLFKLYENARSSVLLAGGIGVTPILSMAQRLARLEATFELHYLAKSPERAPFRQFLADQPYESAVRMHYSAPAGIVGGRADLTELIGPPGDDRHLYMCGPRPFMEAALETARALGWDEACLHYEFFANDLTNHADDSSFRVRIASTGAEVEVPAGQSVVQALESAGCTVPVSCGEGICGVCVTRVLDGIPDHKDLFLSSSEQAANNQFTPCCSRSKTRVLVLDL